MRTRGMDNTYRKPEDFRRKPDDHDESHKVFLSIKYSRTDIKIKDLIILDQSSRIIEANQSREEKWEQEEVLENNSNDPLNIIILKTQIFNIV